MKTIDANSGKRTPPPTRRAKEPKAKPSQMATPVDETRVALLVEKAEKLRNVSLSKQRKAKETKAAMETAMQAETDALAALEAAFNNIYMGKASHDAVKALAAEKTESREAAQIAAKKAAAEMKAASAAAAKAAAAAAVVQSRQRKAAENTKQPQKEDDQATAEPEAAEEEVLVSNAEATPEAVVEEAATAAAAAAAAAATAVAAAAAAAAAEAAARSATAAAATAAAATAAPAPVGSAAAAVNEADMPTAASAPPGQTEAKEEEEEEEEGEGEAKVEKDAACRATRLPPADAVQAAEEAAARASLFSHGMSNGAEGAALTVERGDAAAALIEPPLSKEAERDKAVKHVLGRDFRNPPKSVRAALGMAHAHFISDAEVKRALKRTLILLHPDFSINLALKGTKKHSQIEAAFKKLSSLRDAEEGGA
jgi:hypothetical protein